MLAMLLFDSAEEKNTPVAERVKNLNISSTGGKITQKP